MIFLFVDVIVVRFKYHEAFRRIRLAPDWVFYLCSILGLLASGVGLYATVSAPWVPNLDTFRWDIWIYALVIVSLIVGVAIYFIGQATIEREVDDAEVIAEATDFNGLALATASERNASPSANRPATPWQVGSVIEEARRIIAQMLPHRSNTPREDSAIHPVPTEPPRYVNTSIVEPVHHVVVPKTTPLRVHREYDLRVNIGPFSPDSAVENAALSPFPAQLLPPSEIGHWLEVVVVSDDCEIPRQRHHLFLPRIGASWVCDCFPEREHRCSKSSRRPALFIRIRTPQQEVIAHLRIGIYYEKNLLQSQLLTAEITETEQGDVGYRSIIDYTLTTHLRDVSFLPPRNLHILTNHNRDGTHRIVFNGEVDNVLTSSFAEGQIRGAVLATREALRNIHFVEEAPHWWSKKTLNGKHYSSS